MNLGVVGFGNLGKAFVKGIIKGGKFKSQDIYITAKTKGTLEEARKYYKVNICKNVSELVELCDVIVLVVKPRVAETVIKQIDDSDYDHKVFISIMAGVKIEKLKAMFSAPVKIFRAMPNVSIANLQGVTAISIPDEMSDNEKEMVKDIFQSLGLVIEVREDGIEQITSLSACGLGFVAHLMDSFVEAGTKIGLSREIATQITLQTFYGAVKTTCEYNISPEKLKGSVATKGGATEEGLRVLEEEKVALAIEKAVEASYRKALSFGR